MTATMPDHRPMQPDSEHAPTAAETAERLCHSPSLEGYRIEAISGRVLLTPPPDGDHAVALTKLMRILDGCDLAQRRLEMAQTVGLSLPGPAGEYALPDLSVVDEDFRTHQVSPGRYSPQVFRLVVEVTSTNWQDDLHIKPGAYAAAGVPVYLIGDRWHGEARVLWRPEGDQYTSVAVYKPGETLTLPGDIPAEIPVNVLLQC